MELEIYQVDAFTKVPFKGNPAAVCIVEEGSAVTDDQMQSIAMEMNLAETAFVMKREDGMQIRWFTPTDEVDLCGHATLASAFVIWKKGEVAVDQPIQFQSQSGTLICRQDSGVVEMDFPALKAVPSATPDGLLDSMGIGSGIVSRSCFDYLIEVDSESVVRNCSPDFEKIRKIETRGVILTSQADGGSPFDFVSRFFCPEIGINEDPVTGSAHCCLTPYWAKKLGKKKMIGYQASQRGGIVEVELSTDRVLLKGSAVEILKGKLFL
ncbi:MAG: PhzF family phenazine biosynthesis protein [Planctomycetota bacterium]